MLHRMLITRALRLQLKLSLNLHVHFLRDLPDLIIAPLVHPRLSSALIAYFQELIVLKAKIRPILEARWAIRGGVGSKEELLGICEICNRSYFVCSKIVTMRLCSFKSISGSLLLRLLILAEFKA